MKKFILSLIIICASFFCCIKVSAEECPLVGASHERIMNKVKWDGKIKIYLFAHKKTTGEPIIKTGNFWHQKMQVPGEPDAYCVDMQKSNSDGDVYRPSEVDWNNLVNMYVGPGKRYVDERHFVNMVVSKILIFQDYIDEMYAEYPNRIFNKEQISAIAYAMSQSMAWALIEGSGAEVVNEPEHLRVIVAQVGCALYKYEDLVTKPGNESICTFNPNVSGTTIEEKMKSQTKELQFMYNEANYRASAPTPYAYTINLWLQSLWGSKAHKAFMEGYDAGTRKPTIYKPIRPKQNGSEIQRLLSEYYCDVEPEPPAGCWELEVKIPKICTNSNSGYVKDSEDWNCIFSTSFLENNEINDVLRQHYGADESNDYCEVFCREEIKMELPNIGTSVLQGRYMTVNDFSNHESNNITPIFYTGTKDCRVTSNYAGKTSTYSGGKGTMTVTPTIGKIAWDQFELDYYKATDSVMSAWDAYQSAIAFSMACGARTGGGTVNTTHRVFDKWVSCCTGWSEGKCTSHGTCASYKSEPCSYYHTGSGTGINGEYVRTAGDVVTSSSCNHTRATTDPCIYAASQLAAAKSAYEGAVATRQSLKDKIESCVSDQKLAITYNTFEPTLELEYEEKAYGNEKWKLAASISTTAPEYIRYRQGTAVINDPSSLAKGTISKSAIHSSCSTGHPCKYSSIGYTTAEWWQSKILKGANYNLPAGVYRYVEKGTGQSVHSAGKKSGLEYIDLGISNLPVHYSAKPNEFERGTPNQVTIYDYVPTPTGFITTSSTVYSQGLYDFWIDTSSFGRNNKFNRYIFGTASFSGKKYYDRYDEYLCEYMVKCDEMISSNPACPNEPTTKDGLNLVYRTISMYSKKDAFPGQTGIGRTPGDNWNDNSVIDEYIVKNRDVSNYEIYTKLDPLYEIELTPGIMKKIRKYNKEVNSRLTTIYDNTGVEKDGMIGYSGFGDFECKDSDGRECKSKFLRGQVNGYSEITVKGCAMLSNKAGYTCSSSDIAW